MARICLIGLGLIGGSLYYALKDHHDVVAVDVDPATLKLAKKQGISATKDLKEGLAGADLAIIAVPLGRIPAVLESVAKLSDAKTLVTDVGSVKQTVVKAAATYFKPGRFVGGHPMAGTEHRGLEHAVTGLFKGATYVFTPTSTEEKQVAKKVRAYLAPLQAEFIEMEPSDHDLAVAYTSHLPFLMATAVARCAQGAAEEVPDLPKVAASGFRDTTRLAMSNPTLGKDICMANREALLHALASMRYQLSMFEIMLQNEISTGLESLLDGVGRWREGLKID